ncbi:MAG TPA: DUF3108 domain-containing protein [Terriglobales bacterium]|nr:DUF3108 domain-containing protein [Terriglobales bacterium]
MRGPIPFPRSSTLAAVALVIGTVAGAFGGSPRKDASPATDLKGALQLSPVARIVPPSDHYRFPAHQTYFYNADWHLLNAGTTKVSMESSPQGQHAVVTADTSGFVNLLFAVHDQFRTTINPRTFCSLAVSKQTEEGSRRRQTEVYFDYAHGKSLLQEKDLKTGAVKHVEHPIPRCVTDVMSSFYYVGSLPLAPGQNFVFPLNDGGPTGEITATVEGREQVKTPAGVFPSVRVRAIASAGPMKNKGRVWVWYSDDGQRIPVLLKAKVKWGTLNFRLAKVEIVKP